MDRIQVDYYGTPTSLQGVANISVPEARMIQIQPWDAGLIKDIEKAILASDLGLTPANDGKVIRLVFPELTEERRKELVAEGHRMYDVIRNGMTVKRIDVKDSDINKTKHNTAYLEYDWNYHKILLPIPQKEMDANPNMKQNPGYVD